MKKLLIVIDVQNDFVFGALGTREAQAILPRVRERIEAYRTAGHHVIFTRDTHDDNYLNTNEGKHLPVPHCIKGTPGWQLHEALSWQGCTVIDKPSFGYLDWGKHIQANEPLRIELVGLCTDICVVSNALILKALFPESEIVVDAAACAGVTPETHEAALQTMRMCQIKIQ